MGPFDFNFPHVMSFVQLVSKFRQPQMLGTTLCQSLFYHFLQASLLSWIKPEAAVNTSLLLGAIVLIGMKYEH